MVFLPLFVRQSAVSTSFHSSPLLKHLITTSYPLRSEAQCGITNVTDLSRSRPPGLSNDSSMTSLTTASMSNSGGERKRGFHLRTLPSDTMPGGNIKCMPTCLRKQCVTALPLKIEGKKIRFLINCGFWRAEMVQWRKRSLFNNVACVRFRDRHYIRVEIVGSLHCSLFPGIPLFSPGRTNDV